MMNDLFGNPSTGIEVGVVCDSHELVTGFLDMREGREYGERHTDGSHVEWEYTEQCKELFTQQHTGASSLPNGG